ncbi:FAD-dependent oxidoreductase [Saccharopolyspora spinosa]|nr:FAD-dependent oxidoreductase [Saccharopolyspora spinosa]
MPHLFSPIRIGKHELPNRLYVPAHQEMFAEDGLPSARQAEYYRLRARAGAAMQVTGNTAVTLSQRAEMGPARMANHDDSVIPGYQMLADAVHAEGGRLLAQLSHSGLLTHSANMHVLSASEYRPERTRETASPISSEQIAEVVTAYGAAAARVHEGQLDGVELLMARGSLLGTFLSPAFNLRQDEWGGETAARMRFPLAVVAAVRTAIGSDLMLGVRISADEFIADGMTPAIAGEVAQHLEQSGLVDYLSVTGGTPTHRESFTYGYPATGTPHGLFRHLAAAVKKTTNLPVACVGRVTDPALAEEIVASGDADLVGVVRAQIADPEFFSKAKTGRHADIRPCVGANVCANFHMKGHGVRCIGNPRVGQERQPEPVSEPMRYLVIGGGPGGMEAARALALRGHRVTLVDRGSELGGRMLQWTDSFSRREFRRLIEWWRHSLAQAQVDVRLGLDADLGFVRTESPDHTVLATGATAVPSPINVPTNGPRLITLDDAMSGRRPTGPGAVIDEMGRADAVLIAEKLAESGSDVTLVTSCLHVAEGEGEPTLYPLLARLNELGIRVIERSRVVASPGGDLNVTGMFGGGVTETLSVSWAVHWSGATPDNSLADSLTRAGIPRSVIGDAVQPRRVNDAVSEGAALAETAIPASLARR